MNLQKYVDLGLLRSSGYTTQTTGLLRNSGYTTQTTRTHLMTDTETCELGTVFV